MDAFLILV